MILNDQFRGRTAAGWQPRQRLVKVEPRNPSTGALRVSNAYPVIPPGGRETRLRGPMGRRVLKVVEEYGGGSWSTNSVTKFVYDLPAAPAAQAGGWNLALELDGLSNDSPIARYTWGLDLSRTIHGAGGIGGLLAVDKIKGTKYAALCVYPVIPPQRRETGLHASHGNLGQLIDAGTGQTLAEYPVIPDEVRHTGLREYPVIAPEGRETGLRDPYGREIRAAGTLAAWNRIRFSTKYHDPETGLVYYGYRFYSPRLGRWMSRDPVEESGFIVGGLALSATGRQWPLNSLQAFGNAPTVTVDPLGLRDWSGTIEKARAAWEAAKYACPGSEWAAALNVFKACNSLGLANAYAQTQLKNCLCEKDIDDPECRQWQSTVNWLTSLWHHECTGPRA